MRLFSQKAYSCGVVSSAKGITLAEILVCLLIIAEMATFTIPKVMHSMQNRTWDSNAKDVAGAIASAYQAYKVNHVPDANTRPADLTPYLNYVSVDTTSQFNGFTVGIFSCASYSCLRLHNGGILAYDPGMVFNGATTQNAIFFRYDPDGIVTGTGTANDKSVGIFLYMNGRLTSFSGITSNTTNNLYTYGGAGSDPPWFHWN